ncbi:SIS domain-containing protein [Candidatus Woesearchaeota archaeon]|nr:MAG: SIS domain-containing protein [Candidatus Woesearchaeota archaeon]
MMEERIKLELNESIMVKKNLLESKVSLIARFAQMLVDAYRNNGRLIAFGNGGSAADAQHIVAELVNYLYDTKRPMLDAIALTVNTSVLTAIGNDIGYDNLFSKQLESLSKPEDVVLGISTSGNSENVIRGLKQAMKNGSKTVALVGKGGGKIKDLGCDLVININSEDTARIQEAHITIGHIVCSLVEKELFQEKNVNLSYNEGSNVSTKVPVRISFANGGDTDEYIRAVGKGCVVNATLDSHYYKCSLFEEKTDNIIVNIKNLQDKESSSYEITNLTLDGGKLDIFKSTISKVKPDFKGVILIETNVPMTSGMGGSSSLIVSMIESFFKLEGKPYTAEEVAKIAYEIERNDMGVKGGYQDQWSAAYRNGINFMEFSFNGVKVNNLPLSNEVYDNLEQNLVLFFLEPRKFSGSSIHNDQAKMVVNSPEEVKKLLEEKIKNTIELKDSLLSNDLERFGRLLHKDFELKKKLSSKITTDYVEEVYHTALSNGALGGRISGAGAGGVAFFYCSDGSKESVINALKQKGATMLPFKFERPKKRKLKLVLMAGGKGVRLQPLTYDVPKPMLPIKGKPMLEYQIEWAKKHNITDIIICTGYLSKAIEDHFGDGSRFGVNINYSVEKEKLGTAGPLKLASELIGNSDFIVLHGDIMCNVDLDKLYTFHKRNNALATIVVHPSSHPEDSDLIEVNEKNEVVKFWNKPHASEVPTNLGNSGLHIFSSEVLKYIPLTKFSLEKELLPFLVNNGLGVYAYNTDEFLKDMGTFDRIKWVEEQLSTKSWDEL